MKTRHIMDPYDNHTMSDWNAISRKKDTAIIATEMWRRGVHIRPTQVHDKGDHIFALSHAIPSTVERLVRDGDPAFEIVDTGKSTVRIRVPQSWLDAARKDYGKMPKAKQPIDNPLWGTMKPSTPAEPDEPVETPNVPPDDIPTEPEPVGTPNGASDAAPPDDEESVQPHLKIIDHVPHVAIYAAAVCTKINGPGAWGTVVVVDGTPYEYSDQVPETTLSLMELRAVLEGLEQAHDTATVDIYTSSGYVYNRMAAGTQVKTTPELREIFALLDHAVEGHEVTWHKVARNCADPHYKRALELANAERSSAAIEREDSQPAAESVGTPNGASADTPTKPEPVGAPDAASNTIVPEPVGAQRAAPENAGGVDIPDTLTITQFTIHTSDHLDMWREQDIQLNAYRAQGWTLVFEQMTSLLHETSDDTYHYRTIRFERPKQRPADDDTTAAEDTNDADVGTASMPSEETAETETASEPAAQFDLDAVWTEETIYAATRHLFPDDNRHQIVIGALIKHKAFGKAMTLGDAIQFVDKHNQPAESADEIPYIWVKGRLLEPGDHIQETTLANGANNPGGTLEWIIKSIGDTASDGRADITIEPVKGITKTEIRIWRKDSPAGIYKVVGGPHLDRARQYPECVGKSAYRQYVWRQDAYDQALAS